jgi:hypothetical protein
MHGCVCVHLQVGVTRHHLAPLKYQIIFLRYQLTAISVGTTYIQPLRKQRRNNCVAQSHQDIYITVLHDYARSRTIVLSPHGLNAVRLHLLYYSLMVMSVLITPNSVMQ